MIESFFLRKRLWTLWDKKQATWRHHRGTTVTCSMQLACSIVNTKRHGLGIHQRSIWRSPVQLVIWSPMKSCALAIKSPLAEWQGPQIHFVIISTMKLKDSFQNLLQPDLRKGTLHFKNTGPKELTYHHHSPRRVILSPWSVQSALASWQVCRNEKTSRPSCCSEMQSLGQQFPRSVWGCVASDSSEKPLETNTPGLTPKLQDQSLHIEGPGMRVFITTHQPFVWSWAYSEFTQSGAGEVAQQFTALAALAADLGSMPHANTHTEQFTSAWNSNSLELGGALRAPAGAHTHAFTHTDTQTYR